MTVPSDDDPEQRIRDLEHSGSVAPAETGESSRRGLRAGWALLGLLVVALAAGGAVILSERSTRTVTGAPTAPADLRPPAPPIRTGLPTPEPPIPPIPPVPTIPTPGPGPTGAPPGADISVAGVDTERSITCVDNTVTVSGVNNTVLITGRCRRVDVSGLENVVTIEESASIEVSGLDNRVTYRSGDPQISESGLRNSVGRG